jgi:transcriptional regulator with XRE-family HTH domain
MEQPMIEYTDVRFDDVEWLRRMAEFEDRCESLSVGGLAVDAGIYRAACAQPIESIARDALGKLITFTRRQLRLTAEKFAEKADIELEDLVRLEHAEPFVLDPRTVAQLANALSVPVARLMSLAGLTKTVDPNLQRAAVRFAANAQPLQGLSKEEQAALIDFVKELAERPEGG